MITEVTDLYCSAKRKEKKRTTCNEKGIKDRTNVVKPDMIVILNSPEVGEKVSKAAFIGNNCLVMFL